MSEPDGADWRASWRKRTAVAAIGRLGAPTIVALARTWRWQVDGAAHLDAVGPRFILAVWHGRILPATAFFRGRGMVVIISRNFDGEWIARIVERLGYGTARGSTSRGGARALVTLRRALEDGHPTAFTVDGPRGPRHQVQPGCIWLARTTGCPILPVHFEADRHWTLGSWDRTQIPRPFTRVTVSVASPILVAPDADAGGQETSRVELEAVLRALAERRS